MKKYLAAVALALLVVSAQSPAHAAGKGRNVAKGIAIGLGVGLVAAAVIASSRSSHASSRYAYSTHYRSHGDRCHILYRACRHGDERACWKLDTRC